MQVIHIDDNQNDLDLVSRYIRTRGHEVISFTSLSVANDVIDNADIILMDIVFDGKPRGIDFVKNLRANGVTCPILAVTAMTMPNHIAQYHESGFDNVIEKPFDMAQLKSFIETYEGG